MSKSNNTELQSHRSKSLLTRDDLNKKIIRRLNRNKDMEESQKNLNTLRVNI